MSEYISAKKAIALRESGWLKDRPILPGDLVTTSYWRDHAVRVGQRRSDTGPRFQAQVPHMDKEPATGDELLSFINGQWAGISEFSAQVWGQWKDALDQPHRFEYDLGDFTNKRGQTYRLTLVIRFQAAINPRFSKYSVGTEDEQYQYQRDSYGDWPGIWLWRPKQEDPPMIYRVGNRVLLESDVNAQYIPLITMSEYHRVEAAVKKGKPFTWGEAARIEPGLAGPLHRRWAWDDVLVKDGEIYYILDGKFSTAVEAVVPPDKIPVSVEALWAMAGGEDVLAARLQAEYQTWAAEREAAGEPVDDPFAGFSTMIRLGDHNGYTVYLHFLFSPTGGDVLRFVCLDDQANYELMTTWPENLTPFGKTPSWHYQRLKNGQSGVEGSSNLDDDYDFHSGPWEGRFNPSIWTDDVEGSYLLSGPDGDFWVTESDLYTQYWALLTQREYDRILTWHIDRDNRRRAEIRQGQDSLVEYLIESAGGGLWQLRKIEPGQGPDGVLLGEGISIASAKQVAATDAIHSFPYRGWESKQESKKQ